MKCTNRSAAVFLIFCFCGLGVAPLLAQMSPTVREEAICCPSCGFFNQNDDKFGAACGTSLAEELAEDATRAPTIFSTRTKGAPAIMSATAQEEKQARLLYEAALSFIEQGFYDHAAKYFRRVTDEFPASTYARESKQLAKACEQLVLAKVNGEQKPARSGTSSAAAFSGAFIGGALGTIGALVFLAMLTSGGMN